MYTEQESETHSLTGSERLSKTVELYLHDVLIYILNGLYWRRLSVNHGVLVYIDVIMKQHINGNQVAMKKYNKLNQSLFYCWKN